MRETTAFLDRARQRRRESTARLARRAEREDARWLRRTLRAAGWLAVAALALGALLGASGCCSLAEEDRAVIRTSYHAATGDARDEALLDRERRRAAADARNWRRIAEATGTELADTTGAQ